MMRTNLEKLKKTKRIKINRSPKSAVYKKETIYKILDETFICHIAFKIDREVFIIPTAYGRKDNKLFIHGSNKSRMLWAINSGEDICISVTLVDGIVAARSVFHHSLNYRSVIIFGKGKEIQNNIDKINALKIITEQIIPGRWNDARQPNKKELDVTSVFEFKIDEASAKVRTGPPIDDKEDYILNVWAGVIPLENAAKEPIQDKVQDKSILLPSYIKNFFKNNNPTLSI